MPHTKGRVLMALAVLSLAGCTSAPAPAVAPTPSLSASIDHQTVLDELGYFPADTAWSEAERTKSLTDAADTWWSLVIQKYPDAVRPSATTVEEGDQSDAAAAVTECLSEADVNIGAAYELPPGNLHESVTWYTCTVQYPQIPHPPINDEQLGYLYDYLTQFVVPCLVTRGSTIDAAPPRDTFIAEWPNQHWFPASSAFPDTVENAADSVACPTEVRAYEAG